MSARRLSAHGLVDRNRRVRFTFDGRDFSGLAGDTLASALLANGVSVFGRSFKYHRPRGVVCAGPEEPCALVTVLRDGVREPNIPATMVEIFDGLEALSQNRFPSLRFDLGAAAGWTGTLFSAGFYYKTFMGPVLGPLRGTRFWMFCEWFIRRAAGLGRIGLTRDPARYERMNAFCDVLVVGSGPSGLVAAREAAQAGRKVFLADQEPQLGGSANWSDDTIDGEAARDWVNEMVDTLSAMPNVTLLPRTCVWGYYDDNTLAALERVSDHKRERSKGEPRHRHWTIRAEQVVIATGALERPIVFPGNDRPGIMLASAAERYLTQFGVLVGNSCALFVNNDGGYRAAHRLHEAGARIAAIIDVRRDISAAALSLAQQTDAELLTGYAVTSTQGGRPLREIAVRRFDIASGTVSGEPRRFAVDCLLVSGGWSPLIHLASQAGATPHWDAVLQCFVPPPDTGQWMAVGAARGSFSTQACIADGLRAGARAKDAAEALSRRLSTDTDELVLAPAPVFEIVDDTARHAKAFVDLQHDVTADDIRLAHREGFVSVEHLKRYTTLGMATDQGKTSNVAGLAIMAKARGIPIPEAGTTRFRPPYAGVSLGALAADRFQEIRPHRLSPIHDWHVEHAATMQPAGLWDRPQIFGMPGETIEQAYVREARAVREGVGIVDVSTLGKISVQGPDAAEFLDRVYTNMISTLSVGKARYGLMLREDGIVLDDGTVWRLCEHDYLVTTTTANAGRVMQHLEYYRDTVWPALRVNLTSVTDQWAAMALAGPESARVLAACVEGVEIDGANPPIMGIVRARIDSVPVLICRLSFSGERAYEVYCGAGFGLHVWEALLAAGEPFGIVPYGLEALGALRIEKGHVTGSEIDGRTTARDLNLQGLLSRKKPFIGSAMMDRPGLISPKRLGLVGVIALDDRALSGGGHIVERAPADALQPSIGHVTAACYSPSLGRYIGLAMIEGGRKRQGSRAFISDPLRGRFGPVEIVSPQFYDPEGRRLDG